MTLFPCDPVLLYRLWHNVMLDFHQFVDVLTCPQFSYMKTSVFILTFIELISFY